MMLPNCDQCGRFCNPKAWKMIYSGWPLGPDREIFRCAKCVDKFGAFLPQDGIKPECSCGLVAEAQ